MADEADTVAATPGARDTSGAVSGPLSTVGGSIATSVVMHSEEATRARAFFRLMLGLALLGAAFMPFVEGPALFRAIAMSMCIASAALSVYTLRALRDEE